MARAKRHSAAEIAAKLGRADALTSTGQSQDEIAGALGISVMTLHRWRSAQSLHLGARKAIAADGLMPAIDNFSVPALANFPEPPRLSKIEELLIENTRLRRIVADLLLERSRLEDEAQLLAVKPTNLIARNPTKKSSR